MKNIVFTHPKIAPQSMIIVLSLFILQAAVHCSPPEDPILCSGKVTNTNCTITNSIGIFPDRSICHAAMAVYPSSEAELISAVANATAAKRKMKVTTRYSHSIPKLVCPDGNDGMLISTKNLDRIVSVNATGMSMTVESGVTLRKLIEEAAKVNMALPYAPYWWGLTVGGMMGTGAHGSSLWGIGSQVHDYVTGLRIVSPATEDEGYVKVRVLEAGNPELDAARVSLGLLGVISQVTLKLQPLFKRSVTYMTRNDSSLGSDALGFGSLHEFTDFMWYPSQNTVVYRMDDRVPNNVTGNGLNDFVGFRSTATVVLVSLRTTEEAQELLGDKNGKCNSGKLTTATLRTAAYGLTNNGFLFTGYPVIGFQNRLQASGTCLESLKDALITACPWDIRVKGIFYHQTTFSIALSKVEDFIHDVQSLVAFDPSSTCGLDLYNGILMRYVTASTAYLGKQGDAIDFDITYYRSKDPMTPRLYEDVLEEIEQMAMFKYDALPHWGKNRNVAFLGAIGKFRNASEFIRIKNTYDPLGLFSSEWTDQVLGLSEGLTTTNEGCALEGLCICSEDVHCAPKQGYLCQPGKVYKEARVCSKVDNSREEGDIAQE